MRLLPFLMFPGDAVGAADDFLEGELRESSEKWPSKDTKVGTAVMGVVAEFRTIKGKQGPVDLAELGPVVIRTPDGKKAAFASVAVFLGAVLSQRVKKSDLHQVLTIVYKGEQKGNGPNPFLDFDVKVSDVAKLKTQLHAAGGDDAVAMLDGLPF